MPSPGAHGHYPVRSPERVARAAGPLFHRPETLPDQQEHPGHGAVRAHDVCSIRPSPSSTSSCRNLMIYFDAELQRRLMPLFHYSLRPGGVLLLGTSETVGRRTRCLRRMSKSRLYRRSDEASHRAASISRSTPSVIAPGNQGVERVAPNPHTNLQRRPTRCCCRCFRLLPSSSSQGDIVYISGQPGSTWSPRPAKPTGTSTPWCARRCARGLGRPAAGTAEQEPVNCMSAA